MFLKASHNRIDPKLYNRTYLSCCFDLQVYYYYPFSAIADSAKLYNDLRWNVSRPQGFEAVMRVRCSQVNKEKGASRLGFSFILDKIYTCFLGSSSPRLSW